PLPPTGLSLRLEEVSASLSRSAVSTARSSASKKERNRIAQKKSGISTAAGGDEESNSSPPHGPPNSGSSVSAHDRILAEVEMLSLAWSLRPEGPGVQEDTPERHGYMRPPSRGAESWRPLGKTGWITPEEAAGESPGRPQQGHHLPPAAFRPPSRGGSYLHYEQRASSSYLDDGRATSWGASEPREGSIVSTLSDLLTNGDAGYEPIDRGLQDRHAPTPSRKCCHMFCHLATLSKGQ
ncbi:hypothetical protein FOZ62_012987, partial [Perkinsus olseni]